MSRRNLSLFEYRQLVGVTQEQAASELGCHKSTISRIESGAELSRDLTLKIMRWSHGCVSFLRVNDPMPTPAEKAG